MRSTLRSNTIRVGVALAAVVTLVACGGDDDDDAATTTDAAVTTPGSAATTEAVETTSVDTTEATETTEAVETTEATETTSVETTEASETTAPVEGFVFTSAEGDYSATFPGEPTPQTQAQPLPDGSSVDVVFATYEVDDGFMATARAQYPDGYVLDVPVALQGAQDQALANVGATLIESQDITLQGRPGREFSGSVTSNGVEGTVLQRVFLDGLVIYQQIFTGAGEVTFTDPELATFFESFAFTIG